ncbi:MAG TPA: NAD-binding protein, partial [Micromonosporaceae bacterium]|nr:NAD-binding protein [Micromonosporaceae bacterium]
RVIKADRLDENTFRAAGLQGAKGVALMLQDDVANIHAALCAHEAAPDVPLVLRMFNLNLGIRVKELFADCEVVSDAAMAAPAFVAAALGEVAPTHFRHLGRTLFVARRSDVRPTSVVCVLADMSDPDEPQLLPVEETGVDGADLVLAEAAGEPVGTDLAARRIVRLRRRRDLLRPIATLLRAVRSFVTRKIGVATMAVLAVVAVFGALLARAEQVDVWQALYVTLLTTFSGAEPNDAPQPVQVQVMQVVLTLAGLALIPLITAAVVDGIVNARLALDADRLQTHREGHIVVIGLGNVGTRVLRQLRDLGIEVVAIDKDPAARGAAVANRLGIPFVVGDGAQEETLRLASVATAQALVIVSTDDVTNLEATLNARELNPDLPVVLRLYDGDLAERIQRVFGIGVTRSVSYLAAPTFAAALLDRDVIATIPVERHALLVAEVTVAAGSMLVGQPISTADQAHEVRVVARTPAGGARSRWVPPGSDRLAAGDRLTVVASKTGLRRLLRHAGASSAPAQPEGSDSDIPSPRRSGDSSRLTGDIG